MPGGGKKPRRKSASKEKFVALNNMRKAFGIGNGAIGSSAKKRGTGKKKYKLERKRGLARQDTMAAMEADGTTRSELKEASQEDTAARELRVQALYEANKSLDDPEQPLDEGGRPSGAEPAEEYPEACDVIKIALELALVGQRQLTEFLFREETQEDLKNAGDNNLLESLESEFYDRVAPSSVKGAMLWRFATTIWDFPRGSKKTNLKLALTAYDILLDWCDPYEHQIHYAALQNSLEQAENAFHRVVLANKLENGNKEDTWDIVIKDEMLPRFQGLTFYTTPENEEAWSADGKGKGVKDGRKGSRKKRSRKKKRF